MISSSSQFPFLPPTSSQPIQSVDSRQERQSEKAADDDNTFPELDKVEQEEFEKPTESSDQSVQENDSTTEDTSKAKGSDSKKEVSDSSKEKDQESEKSVDENNLTLLAGNENYNIRNLIKKHHKAESQVEDIAAEEESEGAKAGKEVSESKGAKKVDTDALSSLKEEKAVTLEKDIPVQTKDTVEITPESATKKMSERQNGIEVNSKQHVEDLDKLSPDAKVTNIKWQKNTQNEDNEPGDQKNDATTRLFKSTGLKKETAESVLNQRELPNKQPKSLKDKLSDILKPQLNTKPTVAPLKPKGKPQLGNKLGRSKADMLMVNESRQSNNEINAQFSAEAKPMASMANTQQVRDFLLNAIKGAVNDLNQLSQPTMNVAIEHAVLGKMNLILNNKNGTLNITLESEQAATNSLNSQKTEIVNALKSIGYDSVTLEFSTRDQQQHQHFANQESNADSSDNVKLSTSGAEEDKEAATQT